MTSPYIMLTTSLATAAVVYAFWCSIRMAGKSGQIRERIQKNSPEPWAKLNALARHWNNGQPGILYLHKKKLVDYPGFEEEVQQLRDIERKMLWGIGLAVGCIGLVVAGTRWLGWQW